METTKAFQKFLDLHYQNTQGLRLGQRFFNLYVSHDISTTKYYNENVK